MPLIVKNLVLRGNEPAPTQQVAQPVAQPAPPPVVQQTRPRVRERAKSSTDVQVKPGEPAVIVNGKAKKISKKSAFLLDMLSLDD